MADTLEKKILIDIEVQSKTLGELKTELKSARKDFESAKVGSDKFTASQTKVKELTQAVKVLNDTTKQQSKALGGVNSSAKFVKGSYGELKQEIKSLKAEMDNVEIGSRKQLEIEKKLNDALQREVELRKGQPSLFQTRISQGIDESVTLQAQAEAYKKVSEGAHGATIIGTQFGRMLGINEELLNTFTNGMTQMVASFDGYKKIAEAVSEQNLTDLAVKTEAVTEATESATEAVKTQTTVQKIYNFIASLNPYTLLIAGAAALGAAIAGLIIYYKNHSESLQKANIESELFKEINSSLNKSMLENRLELVKVNDALKETNGNQAKRSELIKSINEQYGTNLSNLASEKEAMQAVNEKVLERIKLKVLEDKLVELYKEQAEEIENTKNEEKDWVDFLIQGATTTDLFTKRMVEHNENLNKTQIEIAALEKEYAELFSGINEFVKEDNTKKAVDSTKIMLELNIKAWELYYKDLQKRREKDLEERKKIEEDAKEASKLRLENEEEVAEDINEVLGISKEQYDLYLEERKGADENYYAWVIRKNLEVENEKLNQARKTADQIAQTSRTLGNIVGNLMDVELIKAGDNEEAKKQIRKKYADEQFIMTAAGIVANTASAAIAAIAAPPTGLGPILGTPFAVLAGIEGATQLAVANAQRNQIKSLDSGGFTGSGAIPDPKVPGRKIAGYVHDNEFVATTKSINKYPHVFAAIDREQRGFADGGFTSRSISNDVLNSNMLNIQVADILNNLPPQIVLVKDIAKGLTNQAKVQQRSTL